MLGLATLCALECYFPRISLFGPCADIIIIIIFFFSFIFSGEGKLWESRSLGPWGCLFVILAIGSCHI